MSNVFIVYRLSEARDSMGNDLPDPGFTYFGKQDWKPFMSSCLEDAHPFTDGLQALKAARAWSESARVVTLNEHKRMLKKIQRVTEEAR